MMENARVALDHAKNKNLSLTSPATLGTSYNSHVARDREREKERYV